MKKTNISLRWWLLLAAASWLLFSGCSICADCTCRITSTQPGFVPVTSESEVCGRSDIRETRGISTQTVTVGNKKYITTTNCDCR